MYIEQFYIDIQVLWNRWHLWGLKDSMAIPFNPWINIQNKLLIMLRYIMHDRSYQGKIDNLWKFAPFNTLQSFFTKHELSTMNFNDFSVV